MQYLVLGEAAPDGTSLLGAEVKGKELLLLINLPERRLLLLQDHYQNLHN